MEQTEEQIYITQHPFNLSIRSISNHLLTPQLKECIMQTKSIATVLSFAILCSSPAFGMLGALGNVALRQAGRTSIRSGMRQLPGKGTLQRFLSDNSEHLKKMEQKMKAIESRQRIALKHLENLHNSNDRIFLLLLSLGGFSFGSWISRFC